ncbi:MAG: hypothetical protein ACRDL6_05270, partial [Solirubrobacterales bacterium]
IYPALAGLTGSAAGRAALGASGYLWLAAAEQILDRKLLFGPELAAPAGWQQSAGVTFGDVLVPLLSGPVLAAAAVWAIAAALLPLLVRGRAPVLDGLGALIWAAALITALRVVAGPGADPPGLLFAALLAACIAALLARRLQTAPSPIASAAGGTGMSGTA